jgi:peptidyl-dipeptidase Dcp
LYNIDMVERFDLSVYHPDVCVFDVQRNQQIIGLFYLDLYARPSKQGGCWMNSIVRQNTLSQELAVVINVLNITKPASGTPTLLSMDEVITSFHEYGHALHGLLSDCRYPSMSGTNVSSDFVELPSQVNENWALESEVVASYAKHYQTGELMPADWIEKIRKIRNFNQGYNSTEYLASALIDFEWHSLSAEQDLITDIDLFEQNVLIKYGLNIAPVPPRYKTRYFTHIWSGGYSASYYAYLYSQILDADAFEWFKQNDGLTYANGEYFRLTLLCRGSSEDEMILFKTFRGREPNIDALLKRNGMIL